MDSRKGVPLGACFRCIRVRPGRFATNEESYFLLSHMRSSFNDSPFGLKQRQDNQNWEWRTTKHVMENAWMWYLLHPVLARVTAHVAPSLVFVFYSVYSSLFVTFTFGWEVTLLFLAQHAALLRHGLAGQHSTVLRGRHHDPLPKVLYPVRCICGE
ncbi:uncharacterized protein LOC119375212 [Rhipicephalus sanguineus]|uniref:uncharacterized protein LOC119375212 n=1 Tax=Rhipicephalus sanguineus TaxID=34632 RepID=UPI0020C2F466|nr:uncharacterized protein LOC119375212 [Rhipicephalus sanguineus]